MKKPYIYIKGGNILIENNSPYESIVGQLQKYTTDILTVKDGTHMYRFKDSSEIPPNLKLESVRKEVNTGTQEYYFRSVDCGSLYCFFIEYMKEWIETGRSTSLESFPKRNLIAYNKKEKDWEGSDDSDLTYVNSREVEVEESSSTDLLSDELDNSGDDLVGVTVSINMGSDTTQVDTVYSNPRRR